MSHFYSTTGESMFEVPKASKPEEMRPTTLRDARKHGWLPSVTTYLAGMINKPHLNKWGKEQVALAASTIPDSEWSVMTPDEKFRRCMKESGETLDKAAKFGGLLHDAVEEHAKRATTPDDPKIIPHFTTYQEWYLRNVKAPLFAEVTVVGEKYAGRLDFIAEMFDGRIGLIDFKTRKRAKAITVAEKSRGYGKFGSYETDKIQLCAYDEAVELHEKFPCIDFCANLMIDSNAKPSPAELIEVTPDDRIRYREAWDHIVDAYCLLHNYDPTNLAE